MTAARQHQKAVGGRPKPNNTIPMVLFVSIAHPGQYVRLESTNVRRPISVPKIRRHPSAANRVTFRWNFGVSLGNGFQSSL